MINRVHRELTGEDITRIADTYQAWRGDEGVGEYVDTPGFCKGVTLDEIRSHGYVLTPGRYVGVEDVEDDETPFEERLIQLSAKLYEQLAQADRLGTTIKKNLEGLGYQGER